MIPVFYINLDARTDRRAFMEAQLERLHIPATRVSAMTPDKLPADIVAASTIPLAARSCTESHRSIWRAMVEQAIPAALILEDDARLSPQLPAFLARPELSDPWFDVIKIETRLRKVWLASQHRRQLCDIEVRRLVSPHMGTAGYVISNATAAELLKAPMNDIGIDGYMFSRTGPLLYSARIFQTVPGLCVPEGIDGDQDIGASDIRPTRVIRARSRMGEVAAKLRQIWWSVTSFRWLLLMARRRTITFGLEYRSSRGL